MKYPKLLKKAAAVLAALFLLTACDPTAKYDREQKAQIQDFLNNHPEYAFELKTSGLYYCDLVVGTGRQPVTHDTVSVFYKGMYLNGQVFDSNIGGNPYIYPANEGYVIPGFEEGVMYMKEGGKAIILLKSDLGYGNTGYYFPAYTPSLFEITLATVRPGPGK